MAAKTERVSADATAYAEKHRILQALEQLVAENWPQFKSIRKGYKKFKNKGKRNPDDRYDREDLLQDCEDKGLIDSSERDLIDKTWVPVVDWILPGMDEALRSIDKGDKLNCWIVYGAAVGHSHVVHQKTDEVVDLVILTERIPPKIGPYKGLEGRDPGFLRRLQAHQEQIGGLIGGTPRRGRARPRRKA
ncbi:MAG TPA: hypothetical protein VMW19_09520 [Myxococcota bacterium]|nr:hypothetical protein [Myxococcota bacterium]